MRKITEIKNYSDKNANVIECDGRYLKKTCVRFYASNCRLIIHKGCSIKKTSINFYCDGGTVEIGANSRYRGFVSVGLHSKVTIGSDLYVTGNCHIAASEETSVSIGDDCMIASDNRIWTHDSHPIFDLKSGRRVNPSRSIEIGNHVWLAVGAAVLSGSKIGDGSVVGFRSVVKGTVPKNVVVAGVPSSIIKEEVHWERENLNFTTPFNFPQPLSFKPINS